MLKVVEVEGKWACLSNKKSKVQESPFLVQIFGRRVERGFACRDATSSRHPLNADRDLNGILRPAT